MRRSTDFTDAVRGGRRAARPTLVLHVRSRQSCIEPARVGLIVGKSVGNAVTRHRVARRLRALFAKEVDMWADGDLIVVRALPAAADANSAELTVDLVKAAERIARASSPAATTS